MSRSKFATGGDALKRIWERFPQLTIDAPRFDVRQAGAFLAVVDGNLLLFKGVTKGRTPDQPLFGRPALPASSVPGAVHLPSVSEFRVSHDTIFDHHKEDGKQRQLEKADEVPRSSSTEASRDVALLSNDDKDDQKDVPMRLHTNTETNDSHRSGLYTNSLGFDERDNDPEFALGYMDAEFSKWSHTKREGKDAVTGDIMRAPADIHATLLSLDRKTWSKALSVPSQTTKVDDPDLQTAGDRIAQMSIQHPVQAAEMHDLHHERRNSGTSLEAAPQDDMVSGKDDNPTEEDVSQEHFPSKRAAIIAKSKAASHSSILTAQSASQKRSALHKNKNRKPITQQSLPNLKQPESTPEAPQEQQQLEQSSLLIFDNTDAGRREALDMALKSGMINPHEESDVKGVFRMMSNFKSNQVKKSDEKGSEERAEALVVADEDKARKEAK
ncbi:Nn.00g077420.m01.CDS01 [Neocucurbitaria sp. VM-36]